MWKWIVGGVNAIAVVIVLWVVGSTHGMIGQVATTGQRIISKTIDPNNIINNYELFHDRWKSFDARVNQIAEYRSIVEDTTDASEKSRVRMELAAIRQQCRKLAAEYNADSTKTNRSIFKGREAPETLNAGECE